MSSDNKFEMGSINVTEQPGVSSEKDASSISILEKQTRTRRLFSTAQLFAFNIVYLGTWYSTGG